MFYRVNVETEAKSTRRRAWAEILYQTRLYLDQ